MTMFVGYGPYQAMAENNVARRGSDNAYEYSTRYEDWVKEYLGRQREEINAKENAQRELRHKAFRERAAEARRNKGERDARTHA